MYVFFLCVEHEADDGDNDDDGHGGDDDGDNDEEHKQQHISTTRHDVRAREYKR